MFIIIIIVVNKLMMKPGVEKIRERERMMLYALGLLTINLLSLPLLVEISGVRERERDRT